MLVPESITLSDYHEATLYEATLLIEDEFDEIYIPLEGAKVLRDFLNRVLPVGSDGS